MKKKQPTGLERGPVDGRPALGAACASVGLSIPGTSEVPSAVVEFCACSAALRPYVSEELGIDFPTLIVISAGNSAAAAYASRVASTLAPSRSGMGAAACLGSFVFLTDSCQAFEVDALINPLLCHSLFQKTPNQQRNLPSRVGARVDQAASLRSARDRAGER